MSSNSRNGSNDKPNDDRSQGNQAKKQDVPLNDVQSQGRDLPSNWPGSADRFHAFESRYGNEVDS